MKRRLLTVLLAGAFALVAVGCGSNNDPQPKIVDKEDENLKPAPVSGGPAPPVPGKRTPPKGAGGPATPNKPASSSQ
jgi:hypothetical protein